MHIGFTYLASKRNRFSSTAIYFWQFSIRTLCINNWILFRFEMRQDHSPWKNFSWKNFPFHLQTFMNPNWVKWERIGMQMFFATKVFHVALSPLLMLNFHLSKAENCREEVEGYVVVRFERERSLLQRTIRGLRGRLRRPLPLQLLHTRKYTTVGDCKAAKTDQCVKKDLSIRKRIRYRNKIMCIWWFDEKSWRLKAVSAWYWNIANTY